QLILDTWDGKIWWPHSESLYAGLVADEALGQIGATPNESELALGRQMREIHDKVFEYSFSTFPNPDAVVGEWIHVRDRRGDPLRKVMGLPVKDPYHLTRNLMLAIELLDEGLGARTVDA